MRSSFASRSIVAIALLVGSGCGSGFGGCGTLKPMPAGLTPFGTPNSQVIEGGVQARLTQTGMQKFSTVVQNLLTSQLNAQLGCLVPENTIFDGGFVGGSLKACPDVQPSCGMAACGASAAFNSADRPAPFNFDDGKDHAAFSMADGTNPVMNVSLSFDLDVNLKISYALPAGISSGTCNFEIYTKHYKGDANQPNITMTAPIQLGIDPTTGALTVTALALQISDLGLASNATGCTGIGSFVSNLFNDIFDGINSSIGHTIFNLATTILQPQINSIIQGLLPHPLGLAGVVDTATMLKSYDAPPEAGLETYLVPGGYVQAKAKGLTLGVLAGMNSDRNPATRTPTNSSEPSLCVPARDVPALGTPPWNLPTQALRNDFTLNPADAFAGSPDPIDPMGNPRDLLLGISRTYFDLIGFHLYNSGTLCLHVDGTALPMLNTGTLGAIIPSLDNIALDPKAPLQLVLRPQQAVVFTLGAGSGGDSLIHMALTDLRIDMYTWIEERWVRFVTIAVDLNLGIDLTVTKDANMLPVLQPVLSGLETANITVRVTNTDLLAETPAALSALLPSIINLASGSLAGALPNISLPSIMGFSLDDLVVGRVQTTQDDFLGVFATLVTPTSTAPLVDWSDPQHPRLAGEVRTLAKIAGLNVPSIEQMRALFDGDKTVPAARPTVTLALDADGANGRALEFAWKVDGGIWREWSQDKQPVIADDAFLFQGHHSLTVRARAAGDYRSEDSQPVTLDFIIDAQAPTLAPHLDEKDQQKLDFGGWDLVTDTDKLVYSYLDENGAYQPFGKQDWLTLAEVGRITKLGQTKLTVRVRDEAGLIGVYPLDVTTYGHGSWGVPVAASASGCGCTLGGAASSNNAGVWLTLIGIAFVLLRRSSAKTALVLVFGIASTLLVGCGCDHTNGQCTVDDECQKQQCDVGKIPQCKTNMCVCTPDLPTGDTGRYSSMALVTTTAYVAAYNQTYGDLMVGSVVPPGRVTNWDFVDGVPDEAPATVGSHVRGGISDPGDDVGQYTSIARTPKGEPVIAYYDATHGALKFASFGAIRWHKHVVDVGQSGASGMNDEIGTWSSLTIDSMGRPGIAYAATVYNATGSGKPEGQLRWAQANTDDPQSAADWTVTVVDSRPLPDAATGDMGGPGFTPLPNSIAIMTAAALRSDDTPGIAYYDRERGNLRYAQLNAGHWVTSILDGESGTGTDTGDVGQFPSLTYDIHDVGHISYVDASHDNLVYVDTEALTPEIVDDGYRPMDETTSDGLASPVYHLVGDNSSIQLVAGKTLIAYQDSTAVELRLATRDGTGAWSTQTVAGHADSFLGAYGFWASARAGGRGAYVGSYAINQQVTPIQYYFEVFFVDLGIIQ